MLVGVWMTKDVITVTPDVSMMKASKIMKDKKIRRIPVIDDKGKIMGIVTDRDIKEASPSKATTLDVHELYYLLSEIKVKDIMTPKPHTVRADSTVEIAAVTMLDNRVGGLPVVDDKDKVVGIITESDVFKVLIDITGVHQGGLQLAFRLSNEPGSLKAVLQDLRNKNARIISVLSSYQADSRDVYIRIHDMEKSALNELIDELKSKHKMLYYARDVIHPVSM